MERPPKKPPQTTKSHPSTNAGILVAPSSPKQPQKEKALYYPSIFQYTCRGALGVSSRHVGSPGSCFGIQSRLSHVRDMGRTCTRDEATHAFEHVVTAEGGYPSVGRGTTNNSDTAHVEEKLSLLLHNHALIYKEEDENASKKKSNNVDEEDEDWHEWSCYGSTQVQLLVLRDIKTQKESIAGVSPHCKLGVSIRDVGTSSEGGGVIGTIRAGRMEVNLVGDYYNDEKEHNTASSQQHHQHGEKQENAKTTKQDPRNKGTVSKKPSSRSQELFGQRFAKASWRVLHSMQNNAVFVKNELSDQFLQRAYEAGERVVGQLPKTWERTTHLMHSVYKMWRNDK